MISQQDIAHKRNRIAWQVDELVRAFLSQVYDI